MVICPECKTEFEDNPNLKFCGYCKTPLMKEKNREKYKLPNYCYYCGEKLHQGYLISTDRINWSKNVPSILIQSAIRQGANIYCLRCFSCNRIEIQIN